MFTIAPAEVAVEAPPSGMMVRVIRIFERRGVQGREFGLNRVEPRGFGRQVNGFQVVTGKVIGSGANIGRQVVHDHIEAKWVRIAGAELGKARLDVTRGLAFTHPAHQAIGLDIIEAVHLFNALLAGVRSALALRLPTARPAHASHGAKFQRSQLVIAHDRPALRALSVQRQNALFFASKSGSVECFHVFVRCQEIDSRCSNCRNHSRLTAGNNLWRSK